MRVPDDILRVYREGYGGSHHQDEYQKRLDALLTILHKIDALPFNSKEITPQVRNALDQIVKYRCRGKDQNPTQVIAGMMGALEHQFAQLGDCYTPVEKLTPPDRIPVARIQSVIESTNDEKDRLERCLASTSEMLWAAKVFRVVGRIHLRGKQWKVVENFEQTPVRIREKLEAIPPYLSSLGSITPLSHLHPLFEMPVAPAITHKDIWGETIVFDHMDRVPHVTNSYIMVANDAFEDDDYPEVLWSTYPTRHMNLDYREVRGFWDSVNTNAGLPATPVGAIKHTDRIYYWYFIAKETAFALNARNLYWVLRKIGGTTEQDFDYYLITDEKTAPGYIEHGLLSITRRGCLDKVVIASLQPIHGIGISYKPPSIESLSNIVKNGSQ